MKYTEKYWATKSKNYLQAGLNFVCKKYLRDLLKGSFKISRDYYYSSDMKYPKNGGYNLS